MSSILSSPLAIWSLMALAWAARRDCKGSARAAVAGCWGQRRHGDLVPSAPDMAHGVESRHVVVNYGLTSGVRAFNN